MWSLLYFLEVREDLLGAWVGSGLLGGDDDTPIPLVALVLKWREVTIGTAVSALVPDGADAHGAEHVADAALQLLDVTADALGTAPLGTEYLFVALHAVIEIA